MKLQASLNGKTLNVSVQRVDGYTVELAINGEYHHVVFSPQEFSVAPGNTPVLTAPQTSASVTSNAGPHDVREVRAPIPGIVVSVAIQEGQSVTAGSTLLVLEAMKMENAIVAPRSGEVAQILVKPGQQVKNGQVLLSFKS